MIEHGLAAVPGGIAGFQAAVSEAYFPLEIAEARGADEFSSAIASDRIGQMLMSRTRVNAPFHSRRRSSSRSEDGKTYVLMLLEEGGTVALRGQRNIVVGPGNIVLINAGGLLESEQRAGGTSLAVSIASPLLTSRYVELDDWCLVPLDSSEGTAAILRECMLCYWRACGGVRPVEADDLTASMVHLIGAAFRSRNSLPAFDSRSSAMHFLRMREIVAANLDNPDLSADFVADSLGISKSYLFMIMNAADTTLGRFILERRLDRGRELLADPMLAHRSVSDIAYEVGFQELSHFSRRFTERFGRSPRAFRGRLVR